MVIVTRDATLEAVKEVLAGAGCVVETQTRLAQPEPPLDGPRQYRQLHGWSAEITEYPDVSIAEPDPVLLPFERPDTEPKRVAVILHETRQYVAAT